MCRDCLQRTETGHPTMPGDAAPCAGSPPAPRGQRWPLLGDSQDPGSLEARVAYHLHRLHLTGPALRRVRYLSRPGLQDLTQGRRPLNDAKAALLAQALNIPTSELTRPLTPDEDAAWAFYRTSARNPRHVWQQAQTLWRAAGLSNRQAAEVMGLPYYTPANALNVRRRPITLSYPPALLLTTALVIPEGPDRLLLDSDKTLSSSRDKPASEEC